MPECYCNMPALTSCLMLLNLDSSSYLWLHLFITWGVKVLSLEQWLSVPSTSIRVDRHWFAALSSRLCTTSTKKVKTNWWHSPGHLWQHAFPATVMSAILKSATDSQDSNKKRQTRVKRVLWSHTGEVICPGLLIKDTLKESYPRWNSREIFDPSGPAFHYHTHLDFDFDNSVQSRQQKTRLFCKYVVS